MKKRILSVSIITVLLLIIVVIPVLGQEDDYNIRLRRDFGYGAGSNVRGNFTISLVGDENRVDSVDFLIDGEVMASVEEPPFRFQFHTDTYGFGVHQLSARVFLLDGSEVQTRSVGMNFVSPEEERQSLTRIFTGIGLMIILPLVISILLQLRVGKRKTKHRTEPGEPQDYGILGGTICPKCGRAFQNHFWGLNLITGKYDRCDHCGKWSFTRRATPEELRAAEESAREIPLPDQDLVSDQGENKDPFEDTKYFDQL